jgi:hypothetical protein
MPLTVPRLYHGRVDRNTKAGTVVTASSTSHTLGSWASLINPVTFDAHQLALSIFDVGNSGTATEMLMNIGIGPTGGGSEQIIIPNLDVGAACQTTSQGGHGKYYDLPVFVKAGLSLSAQIQALISSDTARVRAWLIEHPLLPYTAARWFSYGESTAASRGTSVTGADESFGSWTQIGASNVTVLDHYLWTCGFDALGDTTQTAGVCRVEIGFGPNSSSITTIGSFDFPIFSSQETISGPIPPVPAVCPVPAASTLWARLNGTTAEARGIIIYAA